MKEVDKVYKWPKRLNMVVKKEFLKGKEKRTFNQMMINRKSIKIMLLIPLESIIVVIV